MKHASGEIFTINFFLLLLLLLIYFNILKHMDLMRNWVDIAVEKVSVCVICAVRTVKVWVTSCGIARYI